MSLLYISCPERGAQRAIFLGAVPEAEPGAPVRPVRLVRFGRSQSRPFTTRARIARAVTRCPRWSGAVAAVVFVDAVARPRPRSIAVPLDIVHDSSTRAPAPTAAPAPAAAPPAAGGPGDTRAARHRPPEDDRRAGARAARSVVARRDLGVRSLQRVPGT